MTDLAVTGQSFNKHLRYNTEALAFKDLKAPPTVKDQSSLAVWTNWRHG